MAGGRGRTSTLEDEETFRMRVGPQGNGGRESVVTDAVNLCRSLKARWSAFEAGFDSDRSGILVTPRKGAGDDCEDVSLGGGRPGTLQTPVITYAFSHSELPFSSSKSQTFRPILSGERCF